MSVVLYALVLCGCVYIVTQAEITHFARHALFMAVTSKPPSLKRLPFALLSMLVMCPACSAFWIGILLCVGGYWPFAPVVSAHLEAAVGSCALGAIWDVWGPDAPAYELPKAI